LERLGYTHDLQRRYVQSGWLKRVGRGAFVRAHEPATWQGALHALQTQAALPVHVGGRSALGLLGRGHYLALGGREDRPVLDLFGPVGTTLPAWFLAHTWDVTPRFTRTDMLPANTGFVTHEVGRLDLRVASAERAMLEVLYGMPEQVAPAEARELMEGLVDLRPKVVTTLLTACTSVRVKRVFLMLADQAGHPWLRRVKLDDLDLGSGKRSVAGGGVYVPEHRLAVPAELLADAVEEGG
jgi:hypothetical protein